MTKGYFIRLYDKTSCGGYVMQATSEMGWHGVDQAREGDAVCCGVDGKTYRIVGGISHMSRDGVRLAGTLDSVSGCPCNARLEASLFCASYQNETGPSVTASSGPSQGSKARVVPVSAFAPASAHGAVHEQVKQEIEEEEEEVELEQLITLRIGMFFDGTGNNRHNSEMAYRCFARDVGLADAAEDLRRFCAAQGYDGHGSEPQDSRGNDSSNVARLFELYGDDSDRRITDEQDEAAIPVYVEGIGTSSTEGDSRFSQATGRGAQGVRARVEQSPALILQALRTFEGNNPGRRVQRVEFDIFGFSRGAAAARDFANEVLKGARSVVAKEVPQSSPMFSDAFGWRPGSDFSINFMGLFDTVAAITHFWLGDFNGNNNKNPGIDIRLRPGTAKKIVHLVAQDEHRYNFSLNQAGDADIVLPGVHSDIGGGYRPDVLERVILSKPHTSDIAPTASITSARAYQLALQDKDALQRQYAKYDLPLKVRTWYVDKESRARGDNSSSRRVYAAVIVEREVQSDLSLVYLRIMRELAVRHGVPFKDIRRSDSRLALPATLLTIHEKLMTYALGVTPDHGLTPDDEALIYRRYVHLSAHWNPLASDTGEVDVTFINRPGDQALRTVHADE